MSDIPFNQSPFSLNDYLIINDIKNIVDDSIVGYISTEIINLPSKDYVIAGGVFTSIFHKEPHVKDIDIFILDDQNTTRHVMSELAQGSSDIFTTHQFVSKTGNIGYEVVSHGEGYLGTKNNKMLVGTITLTPGTVRQNSTLTLSKYDRFRDSKIQFILTKYKTREDLIAHFDFVHCQMNYHDHKLFVSPYVLDAIKNKELINNQDNVEQWRIDKYKAKGYSYKDDNQQNLDIVNGKSKNQILSKYIDEHIKKILDRKTTE